MAKKRYWLMKSEPATYSIDDLARDGTTCWEGVRNYQARNFMRDEMRIGDDVLFYHSNAAPPGVAGIARVCTEAYPDHEQFKKTSKYYDPKATKNQPRWFMVDIEHVESFPDLVTLETIKATPDLAEMLVAQRGQRLSIQPVEPEHFRLIRKLGRKARAAR